MCLPGKRIDFDAESSKMHISASNLIICLASAGRGSVLQGPVAAISTLTKQMQSL